MDGMSEVNELDTSVRHLLNESTEQAQPGSIYANVGDTFTLTTQPIAVDTFTNHVEYLGKVNGFDKEFKVRTFYFVLVLVSGTLN
jgi:hypothetical protein